MNRMKIKTLRSMMNTITRVRLMLHSHLNQILVKKYQITSRNMSKRIMKMMLLNRQEMIMLRMNTKKDKGSYMRKKSNKNKFKNRLMMMKCLMMPNMNKKVSKNPIMMEGNRIRTNRTKRYIRRKKIKKKFKKYNKEVLLCS